MFLISLVLVLLIFLPRYFATRQLANFVQNFRVSAEESTDRIEEKNYCDYANERDALSAEEKLSLRKKFSQTRKLWREQRDCLIEEFRYDYDWIEDNILELEHIRTEITKYENESSILLKSLKRQKEILDTEDDVNAINQTTDVEIQFVDCKEDAIFSQMDLDNELFYEGYDEGTFEQAVEECEKEYTDLIVEIEENYPNLETQTDEFFELRNEIREITKRLNTLLNN